ncbi:hypothetical protein PQR63_16180 [Herbaspirillum rhizosphaerae]|uniref:Uncharacterized protein n=1 Tax=Herbaspirillum rhizosphaerae TaxID=346179 RepID=A0ABW8Z9X1_9BURK
MSHASHQEHEQARRNHRQAELRDRPEELPKDKPEASRPRKTLESGKRSEDKTIKGTAPAAPPKHEDEAFDVFEGNAPQSDG